MLFSVLAKFLLRIEVMYFSSIFLCTTQAHTLVHIVKLSFGAFTPGWDVQSETISVEGTHRVMEHVERRPTCEDATVDL